MPSRTKATETFRPWWDLFFRYCSITALTLSIVLFFSVSRLEREIIVEESNGGAGELTAEDEDYFGESLGTRSAVGGEEATDGGDDDAFGGGGDGGDRENLSDVTESLMRIKQDLLSDLTGRVGVRRTTTISNHSAFHATFVLLALAASGAILLCDLVFSALFYSHHLVHMCCCFLRSVEGFACPRSGGGGASRDSCLFFNALYHSNDKRSLRHMLETFNASRLTISLPFFILAVHAVASVEDKDAPYEAQHVLGVLLAVVVGLLTVLSAYGAAWPWLNSQTLWGRLMATYARTVDKLDVARGRCVPSPPYGVAGKARVLESLNPYASNGNLKLILDLVALRSGVGLALKCLALMEADVDSNWRPFKLEVREEEDEEVGTVSLVVEWRDPLAVLYLKPVPKELRLHFGVKISFPDKASGLDPIMEMVAYDDVRYYQQMWRSAEPGAVHMGSNKDRLSYLEVFPDFPVDQPAVVDIWTVVDGHLITKSSVLYKSGRGVGDGFDGCKECSSQVQHSVPKPPRSRYHGEQQIDAQPHDDGREEEDGNGCSAAVKIVVQPATDDEDEDEWDEEKVTTFRKVSNTPKEIVLTPSASSVFDFEDEEGEEEAVEEEDHGGAPARHNNNALREIGSRLKADAAEAAKSRTKSLGNLRGDSGKGIRASDQRLKKSRSHGARIHQEEAKKRRVAAGAPLPAQMKEETEADEEEHKDEHDDGHDDDDEGRMPDEEAVKKGGKGKSSRSHSRLQRMETLQGSDNEGYQWNDSDDDHQKLYIV